MTDHIIDAERVPAEDVLPDRAVVRISGSTSGATTRWAVALEPHPAPLIAYDTLRDAVGGFIERVQFRVPGVEPVLDCWVNEDGLLRGLEPNLLLVALTGYPGLLVGNALICKGDAHGESLPLTGHEALHVVMRMQRIVEVSGGVL